MEAKEPKHNLISPNEATSYFTMSGKSFPKYISKLLHKGAESALNEVTQ